MSSVSLRIHRLEPQSARGRARLAKILDAAADLFLEVGYEQTSIDAILQRSGGSKSTLYAYFPTKQDLFRSVIDSVADNGELSTALDISVNARVVLTEFAVARQRVVLSPRHRAVVGLVVAERDRFPDLAEIYWDRGPHRSGRQLITYLEALRNREILAIDDAAEAAEFLIGMVFQHWHRQLFYVALPPPSDAAIRAHAERVVARFWAAYRRGPHWGR
jgi:AcrR family transcriptional regulator